MVYLIKNNTLLRKHLGTVSRWICMDMYGYEWICGYVMDKCHGYMDTWISCFSSGVYLSKKQYTYPKQVIHEISITYPWDIHEISIWISIYPRIHEISRWISIGNVDMWINFGYLPHVWICKDMWICG